MAQHIAFHTGILRLRHHIGIIAQQHCFALRNILDWRHDNRVLSHVMSGRNECTDTCGQIHIAYSIIECCPVLVERHFIVSQCTVHDGERCLCRFLEVARTSHHYIITAYGFYIRRTDCCCCLVAIYLLIANRIVISGQRQGVASLHTCYSRGLCRAIIRQRRLGKGYFRYRSGIERHLDGSRSVGVIIVGTAFEAIDKCKIAYVG